MLLYDARTAVTLLQITCEPRADDGYTILVHYSELTALIVLSVAVRSLCCILLA